METSILRRPEIKKTLKTLHFLNPINKKKYISVDKTEIFSGEIYQNVFLKYRDNRNTGLSRRFVDFFPRCIENQVGQIRI